MSETTLEGIDAILSQFKALESMPQKQVTKAAKRGATLALNFAKANLQPVHGTFLGRQGTVNAHQGGDLKKNLKLIAERSHKGKKVYRISADWYAHFKDLGFTPRNGQPIEGSHFLRYALTEHDDEIRNTILEALAQGIQTLIDRGGG